MLLSLQFAEKIITIILLLLSYAISATFSEAGQAWIAKKMGDDTAERNGWLTLNPLAHVDAIGALFVIFFGIAWIRFINLSQNFDGAYKTLKKLVIYFSHGFINFLIAFIALVILVLRFGQQSLVPAINMFLVEYAPLSAFAQMYPDRNSLDIVFALLLISLVTYTIIIASISLIANGIYSLLLRREDYVKPNTLILIWFLAFIFILFLANPLRIFLMQLISKSALVISNAFGIA